MFSQPILDKFGLNSGGVFFVEVNLEGEESPRRERVNFTPNPETPDIASKLGKF